MNLQKKTIAQVLSVSLFLFLIGCADQKEKAESPVLPTTNEIELIKADLAPVTLGKLHQSLTFTGTIEPIHQTTVQAQVNATALAVLAEVGQYVNKGQTLVRLNNQDNNARLLQAQANLASAKAQAELNRSVMQRKNNLYQQGFISKLEYEQSQLEYRAQQENVKAQQANVDIAQKASQDTIITSPISGYITQRQVDVGQTVSLGQTLFEIVDNQKLELKANISSSEQHVLKIGKTLQFRIQGSDIPYSATITRISPVANQVSRNLEFYAQIDQNTKQLSIGSFVEGEIIANESEEGQLVPLRSVQSLQNQPHIWVIREQKLLKVPVEVLQLDSRQELALVKGLNPTDQVSTIKFDDKDADKKVRLQ